MQHGSRPIHLLLGLLLLLTLGGCGSTEQDLAEMQQHLREGNYRSAEITGKSLLTEAQQQADKELERAARLLLARTYFSYGDNVNSARFYDALPLPVALEAAPASASITATDDDWHQWLLAAWDSGNQKLSATILQLAKDRFGPSAMAIYKVRQLLAAGNSSDARSAFELTTAPTPEASLYVRYQYALLRAAVDPDEALRVASDLLAQQPDFAQAVLLKARLLQAQGDSTDALAHYQRYGKLRPADAKAMILTTLTAFQVGQYDTARELVATLSRQLGQHPMILQFQGMLALHDKRFDDAKAFGEKSLAHGLESPMNHLLIGIGAYQQKAWEQANRHLALVSDQLPKDHFARKMLVETKLQLHQPKHAAAIFKNLDTDSVIDVALANRVSAQLIGEGGYEDATAVQRQVADIAVAQEELVLQRQALDKALRRNEFKAALIESIKGQDSDAKDKLRLILLYLADKETENASRLAGDWLQASPRDVNALNAAALVEQHAGRPAAMKSYLDKALAIDPQNIPSLVMQLNLARIEKDLPAIVVRSKTLMEDIGFVNPLIFNYWLEASFLLKQPNWEQALRLAKAKPEQQLEGVLLSFLLKSQQYDRVESYLAQQVAQQPWTVRHWASAVLAAIGAGERELAAKRMDEFINTNHFKTPRVAEFIVASAARAELYKTVLTALQAADKQDIAISDRDLIASGAYIKLGQLDKARQVLASHGVEDNRYFEARADLAIAEEDYRAAWQALDKAIAAEITFPQLAKLYLAGTKINQHSAVKQHVRTYFRAHPADNMARRQASQWYMADSPRFAIEILDSGSMQSELKTDWISANNLAWLYHQVGDQEKARFFAESAISRAPERAEVIDTYVTVFGRKPRG